MASNHTDAPTDDFLQEILGLHSFASGGTGLVGPDSGLSGAAQTPMMLQLSPGDGAPHFSLGGAGLSRTAGFHGFPLSLSLEQGKGGFIGSDDVSVSGKRFRDDVVDGRIAAAKNVFHGQSLPAAIASAPLQPAMRPRMRARRGQATDPHSIAERLRRERIAERIRALQELVPSVNKTDRAAMLDEIVDYVKFLRLQVKVLSMSRLGGAGAVAPLVTDVPVSSVEDESGGGEGKQQAAWEKWGSDGTEREVAKLMEENVGAAMQFLQSKSLCIMPISLASAIYHSQPSPDTSSAIVKSETNHPSS